MHDMQGLWLGILCGLVAQTLLLLAIFLGNTNWDQQVSIPLFVRATVKFKLDYLFYYFWCSVFLLDA
jgi:hypothetical protein